MVVKLKIFGDIESGIGYGAYRRSMDEERKPFIIPSPGASEDKMDALELNKITNYYNDLVSVNFESSEYKVKLII